MSVSKRPRTNEKKISIPELYQQCTVGEQKLATPQDLEKFKLILAKGYFFDQILFLPPPAHTSSAQHTKIEFELSTQIWEAGKYRRIIDVLKKQTTQEGRLLMFALWLRAEQICEPENILGTEVLRRLAKRRFRCISPIDLYHAGRVEKWLPYFERLRTDVRVCNRVKRKLMKLGYDEAAVRAAAKTRSAIPAACEWLAHRRNPVSNVGASSLRNAHSRHYGAKFRAVVEAGRFSEAEEAKARPSQNPA
jgi:hypothetical protein